MKKKKKKISTAIIVYDITHRNNTNRSPDKPPIITIIKK